MTRYSLEKVTVTWSCERTTVETHWQVLVAWVIFNMKVNDLKL